MFGTTCIFTNTLDCFKRIFVFKKNLVISFIRIPIDGANRGSTMYLLYSLCCRPCRGRMVYGVFSLRIDGGLVKNYPTIQLAK